MRLALSFFMRVSLLLISVWYHAVLCELPSEPSFGNCPYEEEVVTTIRRVLFPNWFR